MITSPWNNPEVVETLSSSWATSSASQISTLIWEKHRVAVSRNAVVGRLHRMGLTSENKACDPTNRLPREPRKYKPRLRIVSANGNSNRQRIIVVPDAEQFQCRAVDVIPRNLTLLELEPGDCRYPYGDSEFTFCGHPHMEGSSYCGPHFSLTRGAPPIRTRSYADIGKGCGGVFGRVA